MLAHYKNLFKYDAWANARLIDSLLLLDQVPQRGMDIMSHIMGAHRIWYDRLIGVPQSVAVWPEYAPGEWHQAHQDNVSAFSAYLDSMTEEKLLETVTYHNSKGIEYHTPIHEILTHLNLHSTYHRGQVILLMKTVTANLPETDYIVYQREQAT